MSDFDLTLIRKKLAKDLGKSAGQAAKPVKGPYDVHLAVSTRGRYLKLAGVGLGVIFVVGLASFLLEPSPPSERSTEEKHSSVKASSAALRPLEKLGGGLAPTQAVSAPMKAEPTRGQHAIDLKGVEKSGHYVQVAAYRGQRFLQSAQERIASLGFSREMVVKETFWTPQYVRVEDPAGGGDILPKVTAALSGIKPGLLSEKVGESGVRVGPIYYSELLQKVESRLTQAGLPVRDVEVAERELIYILLLGPYESDTAAAAARGKVTAYAPDSILTFEKGQDAVR